MLLEFEKSNCYVVKNDDEKKALRDAMFEEGAMSRHAIGQAAKDVAKLAKISVPDDTKVIVVIADGVGAKDLFAKEKMCPVISVYTYDNFEDAIRIAEENLEVEGKGHSVSIHSNNIKNIELAGERICVSRLLVNQVCASNAGGSFYNGLAPTNTLGCGSWGNNSISENLDYKHLINISRIAYFMPNNKIPDDNELWG